MTVVQFLRGQSTWPCRPLAPWEHAHRDSGAQSGSYPYRIRKGVAHGSERFV